MGSPFGGVDVRGAPENKASIPALSDSVGALARTVGAKPGSVSGSGAALCCPVLPVLNIRVNSLGSFSDAAGATGLGGEGGGGAGGAGFCWVELNMRVKSPVPEPSGAGRPRGAPGACGGTEGGAEWLPVFSLPTAENI